jgi:hypothetical protein
VTVQKVTKLNVELRDCDIDFDQRSEHEEILCQNFTEKNFGKSKFA